MPVITEQSAIAISTVRICVCGEPPSARTLLATPAATPARKAAALLSGPPMLMRIELVKAITSAVTTQLTSAVGTPSIA
ncbi:hypothetical protein OKW50_006596 [Paraburkholderia youngii]